MNEVTAGGNTQNNRHTLNLIRGTATPFRLLQMKSNYQQNEMTGFQIITISVISEFPHYNTLSVQKMLYLIEEKVSWTLKVPQDKMQTFSHVSSIQSLHTAVQLSSFVSRVTANVYLCRVCMAEAHACGLARLLHVTLLAGGFLSASLLLSSRFSLSLPLWSVLCCGMLSEPAAVWMLMNVCTDNLRLISLSVSPQI